MEIWETIRRRIKEARVLKGFSQNELAGHLNVEQAEISNWELGKRKCDIENLFKISQFTGKSVVWLLGLDESESHESSAGSELISMFSRFREKTEKSLEKLQVNLDRVMNLINARRNVISFEPPQKEVVLEYIEQPVGAGKTLADFNVIGVFRHRVKGKPGYAFLSRGDSMEPDIKDGALLFVRATSLDWKNDDYCVVYLKDTNEWTVKRVRRDPTWSYIRLIGSREEKGYRMQDIEIQGVVEDWINDPEEIKSIIDRIYEYGNQMEEESISKDNKNFIRWYSNSVQMDNRIKPSDHEKIEVTREDKETSGESIFERGVPLSQDQNRISQLLEQLVAQNHLLLEENRRQNERLAAVEKNLRESEELARKGFALSKESEQVAAVNFLLTAGRITHEEAQRRLRKIGINLE
ncbi:MAG: helix-turn-helix domain-containing protein [Vulcanimicrobiota bacterium]